MNMYKKAKREKQAQQAQQQRAQAQSQPRAVLIPASATPRTPAGQLRSMEQERAEFALKKIQGIADGAQQMQEEVVRHLNGLPALIRMNGLGQALAFYRMKGTATGHELIYRMVGEWLCAKSSKGRVFPSNEDNPDVLAAITRSDIQQYMAAQNEALALLEWLKKFALALLKKSND